MVLIRYNQHPISLTVNTIDRIIAHDGLIDVIYKDGHHITGYLITNY